MLCCMASNKRREATQLWQTRLQKFVDSGLTAKEFTTREGLSPQAFFRWKRILGPLAKQRRSTAGVATKQIASTPHFIQLFSDGPPSNREGSTALNAEIVVANGTRIIVPLSVIERYLAHLFEPHASGAQ